MIKLLNYNEHPTRKAYTVFHFFTNERSDLFKKMLDENEIWYEFDAETTPERTIYLFGIKNSDFTKALDINHLVIAKYRKPTIPYFYLRMAIYLISAAIIILAIISYFKNGNQV